jgi:hypothetical protein
MKADPSIFETLIGIRNEVKVDPVKQDSSICVKRDFDSNVNISICEFKKEPFPRISTEHGMQIRLSKHFEKHQSGISLSCDLASNVKSSILALAKQDAPRVTTERGMQIDINEHE